MRTLLMVTFHFPPSERVGAFRPLRFCRHLRDRGWRLLVLTVRGRDPTAAAGDEALGEGIHVERTAALLPGEARRIKSLRSRGGLLLGSEDAGGTVSQPSTLYRVLRRVKDAVLIPDEHMGWIPFAVARGARMIRREDPGAILATAPPHSSLLVGSALARYSGLPWIADLRDPWTADPFARDQSALRHRIDRWLEGRILRSASRILVTADGLADRLCADHPQLDRSKIVTVRHGFDPELFANLAYRRNDRFTLTHTGTFYAKISPVPFLEGLRKFMDRAAPDRDTIRVRFIGGFDPENRERTTRTVQSLDLEPVVEFCGWKSHRASVRAMVESEVLLYLIAPGTEGNVMIRAKTWEYIASGRPILGLIPEDAEAASILRRFGRGPLVSPPDNIGGIADTLSDLYGRWLDDDLKTEPPDPAFDEFSAAGQVEKLAGLLDGILAPPSARGAGADRPGPGQ